MVIFGPEKKKHKSSRAMSSPAVLEIQSPSSMHWCSPADRRHPWASRRSRTPFGSKVILQIIQLTETVPYLFWGGYDLKQISSEIELDQNIILLVNICKTSTSLPIYTWVPNIFTAELEALMCCSTYGSTENCTFSASMYKTKHQQTNRSSQCIDIAWIWRLLHQTQLRSFFLNANRWVQLPLIKTHKH